MLEKHQQQYVKKHFRKRHARIIAKHLSVPLHDVEAFIGSLKTPGERRREKLFRILLPLFPVLFFVALEIALRAGDFEGNVDLFRERVINGREFFEVNPDVKRRYFRTVSFDPAVSVDVFAKEKSPETYRIFCLGGSSTIGYPYLYNGSFSVMVRDRLSSIFPEKQFEVINLGMTAVNSYTVLDFTKELLKYEPDLILIYAGHNEFYGALGVASAEFLGKSRWMVKAYLSLEQFKTFWLVRDGVAWVSSLLSRQGRRKQSGTLMERMVSDESIPYEGDDYRLAREVFRANLEEVAAAAKGAGVKLIMSTLVSNWRGMPPFESTFSAETIEEVRQTWNQTYDEGRKEMESGNFREAVEKFTQCVSIDSLPAKAHFALGQCLEKLERYGEARGEFVRAKDYDGLRFRASSDFNRTIEEVSSEYGLHVADAEEIFTEHSPHGIIGDELVLEHLHPTVDGYFLIAQKFVETMRESGCIAPKEEWPEGGKSDEELRRVVGVTGLDSTIAAMRLEVLMQSWPFTKGNVSVNDVPAQTEEEKLAKNFLTGKMTWEQAHVASAERFEERGEFSRAANEYRALIKQTPYNVSPYLRLGAALMKLGKDDEAEEAFRSSLKVEDTYFAHMGLASICEKRKSWDIARREIELALQLLPVDQPVKLAQTRYNLAIVLMEVGDRERARSELEKILRRSPNFQPAQVLLRKLSDGK